MYDRTLPEDIVQSAKTVGIIVDEMLNPESPKLLLNYNKIVGIKETKGLTIEGEELENGVMGDIIVEDGVKIKEPVHLCFGVTPSEGVQEIIPRFIVGDDAEVSFLAHCSFPNAIKFTHKMEGEMIIGKNSKLFYEERHYHGKNSGAKVYPVFEVHVGPKSKFISLFSLTHGTVGTVNINMDIYAHQEAKVEIETKAYGKNKKDRVEIRDAVFLEGKDSKSIIKMRAAATNGGVVLMKGITEANAPGATGHVDCKEIVQGFGSIVAAIPIVRVTDDHARVTHEAAVGRVSQKELDTLMARGLTEDEAVDMIIRGIM
ncbi:MAG: SufD family Fe-S cluster assembly protein [Candidatus Wukongarchaeota archaeon]|jgi:Fe-S cluster assembly scaffold protein SufB|nr:SufD family Fe-S cluster assembly protein [Candidatus Wukongarchaeota archaeon]